MTEKTILIFLFFRRVIFECITFRLPGSVFMVYV